MRWSILLAVVVVVVIVVGIWVSRPQFVPGPMDTTDNLVHAQIGAFSTALDMFKLDNGFYPAGTNGLNDLVSRPARATNWHRYLDKIPQDHWGHPYLYVSPGRHNTNSYDLSSAGPDGILGTPDDIVNW